MSRDDHVEPAKPAQEFVKAEQAALGRSATLRAECIPAMLHAGPSLFPSHALKIPVIIVKNSRGCYGGRVYVLKCRIRSSLRYCQVAETGRSGTTEGTAEIGDENFRALGSWVLANSDTFCNRR